MEQQNKYYTPDISELHVGWEGEACFVSSCGWIMIDFNKDGSGSLELHEPEDKEAAKFWSKFWLIEKESLFTDNNTRNHETALMLLKDNRLRGKYLDQSDIESLGWENCRKLTDWFGKNDKPNQVGFDMQNMMLGYDYDSHILAITVTDPTKSEDGKTEVYDYPKNVKWFRGECKSINELRKLMEWLNIK